MCTAGILQPEKGGHQRPPLLYGEDYFAERRFLLPRCFFPFKHLVQILILPPVGNVAHCKLGYFRDRLVGLYLPRRSTRVPMTIDPLLHSVHTLLIV